MDPVSDKHCIPPVYSSLSLCGGRDSSPIGFVLARERKRERERRDAHVHMYATLLLSARRQCSQISRRLSITKTPPLSDHCIFPRDFHPGNNHNILLPREEMERREERVRVRPSQPSKPCLLWWNMEWRMFFANYFCLFQSESTPMSVLFLR